MQITGHRDTIFIREEPIHFLFFCINSSARIDEGQWGLFEELQLFQPTVFNQSIILQHPELNQALGASTLGTGA